MRDGACVLASRVCKEPVATSYTELKQTETEREERKRGKEDN